MAALIINMTLFSAITTAHRVPPIHDRDRLAVLPLSIFYGEPGPATPDAPHPQECATLMKGDRTARPAGRL